jgi:DNA-binding NtrC family response regulator
MGFRRIVVVSRYAEIQQLAGRIAQQVLFADDVAEAIDIAATVAPDLMLLDDLVQPGDIRRVLDSSHNNFRAAIIIAATSDVQPSWISQLQQPSVFEYLPNTGNYEQLQQILSRINAQSKEYAPVDDNGFFADDLASSVYMAGKSKAILYILKMIKLVGASACNPVLITGQTGTGKELAAKAVHNVRHPNEQFVAVNCAALTANLLESELFGHVRGAFTGADKDKTGLLELAGEGTIFLDEISELPLDLQAKLLRVIQEKTFRKVGGITDLACKATIIVSSNRNLRQEVHANHFRRDLYYRLNVCPITIAPLSSPERRDDIRLLADYFLRNSTVCPDKTGKITSLTAMAIEAIEKHNWPGNVRELRNVIERAILLETADKIGLSNILIDADETASSCIDSDTSCDGIHNTRNAIHNSNDPGISAGDFSLEKAERELIARALQESGWQKTRAAEMLGITRATLYAKVKQHNIQKGTYIPKLTQETPSMLVQPETVSVVS